MLTKKPPTDPSTAGKSKNETSSLPKTATPGTPAISSSNSATQIVVKFNSGFGNSLFIRGDGAGLSWEKGIQLKNIDADTWVWESDRPFTQINFKIVLNDERFELGENHSIKFGSTANIHPNF